MLIDERQSTTEVLLPVFLLDARQTIITSAFVRSGIISQKLPESPQLLGPVPGRREGVVQRPRILRRRADRIT